MQCFTEFNRAVTVDVNVLELIGLDFKGLQFGAVQDAVFVKVGFPEDFLCFVRARLNVHRLVWFFRFEGFDGEHALIPARHQGNLLGVGDASNGDVDSAVHWERHGHEVTGPVFPTDHFVIRGNGFNAKAHAGTASTLFEFNLVRRAFDGDGNVPRPSVTLQHERVAWLIEDGVKQHFSLGGYADALKRFIVVQFERCTVVVPDVSICKLSHDVDAGER